ncbi:hypothetical protein [Halopiger thermotolerans]
MTDGKLTIAWTALYRFDADLAAAVPTDPLAVHDEIVAALGSCDAIDGIDPRELDVTIRGVPGGKEV